MSLIACSTVNKCINVASIKQLKRRFRKHINQKLEDGREYI
jgi:hypothetical protein